MAFQGADTQQLRAQASLTRQGSEQLRASALGISRSAQSVIWYGEDAERFRESCSLVVRKMEALGERLTVLEDELDRHTEEQDTASDGDGTGLSGLSGLFGGLLGGPFGGMVGGLLGLLGGMSRGAGPASPFLGMGGGAAGLLAGLSGGGFDTTGLANEMGTPIDPATFDQDGETTVNRGSSTKTGNRTESEETTVSDDGSVTQSYSSKTEVEFEVGNDDNGGSVTFSRSAGGSVTTHDDGSMTFEFEGSVGGEAEAHGQVRGVEGSVKSSAEATGTLTIHLPPGTPPEAVDQINPFDPSTLPEGGKIVLSGELSAAAGAGLGYKDVVSADLELTSSKEYVTEIAKGEDGTVTLDRGPGDSSGINFGLQIGPDEANVKVEGSGATKTSYVQHAEFENSDQGTAAFQEMLVGGELPPPEREGVNEVYKDKILSKSNDISITATAGVDGSTAHAGAGQSNAQIYDVTREYPDGEWVREHQFRPNGEGKGDESSPYSVVHTSSDGDPVYELRYPRDGSAPPTSYNEMYGNAPYTFGEDQMINVQLTEAEMDQLIENRGKGETPEEVLNAYATEGAEGARRMAEDYSGTGPGQGGAAPGEVTAPGAGVNPAQGGGGGGTGSPGSTRATPSAS